MNANTVVNDWSYKTVSEHVKMFNSLKRVDINTTATKTTVDVS